MNLTHTHMAVQHLQHQVFKIVRKVFKQLYIIPSDMKGCICHFTKWQINPFISKGSLNTDLFTLENRNKYQSHCSYIE